ncbi:hypothetical protein EXIGLDRAFT_783046 [Exidia glandulosa HHB12029]|uniref:DUF659 domain-containing protein n=1 Tax=Exidia glandulosa HHB12029 TaxID=1314781 RepID=A0A166NA78_EXIGL|nr:hypothetical protein EXIGLDRAFT_783046 [Exidia glandulosa HHB12029]
MSLADRHLPIDTVSTASTSSLLARDSSFAAADVEKKLLLLNLLFANLPGNVQAGTKLYCAHRFMPDDDWIKAIGSYKGVLNRQLEVVFGPRRSPAGNPIFVAFKEKGEGLLSVVDVLRSAPLGSPADDADALLLKWLDNLIESTQQTYKAAGQEDCKFVSDELKRKAIAAKKSLSARTAALVSSHVATMSSSSAAATMPPAFNSFSQARRDEKRDLINHTWKSLFAIMDACIVPVSSATVFNIQLIHESAHVLQSSLKVLKDCYNLTLSMDGGGIRTPMSIYTVHVTTAVTHDSHLIAGQIPIGIWRFAAMVTDSASNICSGAKRIVVKHKTILNLSDAPHGLNNTIKGISALKYFSPMISQMRQLLMYLRKLAYTSYHLKSPVLTSTFVAASRVL